MENWEKAADGVRLHSIRSEFSILCLAFASIVFSSYFIVQQVDLLMSSVWFHLYHIEGRFGWVGWGVLSKFGVKRGKSKLHLPS